MASVRRRAAAVVRATGLRRLPVAPERYAGRCGVAAVVASAAPAAPAGAAPDERAVLEERRGRTVLVVDRRLPPHTPQWNGAVALGLGEALVPRDAAGEARRALAEAAAAELLLPMAAFRPLARRTDLTADGLRDLAAQFGAPLRLTARQWLASGFWHGFALLWRAEGGALRLRWRAASAGGSRRGTGVFPPALVLGADAAGMWAPESRLFATHRTGRAHHGVEEVRTGRGTAWWFTRFAAVRERPGDPSRAVLAMVLLAPEGMPAGRSK